jgi:hypothetical protein
MRGGRTAAEADVLELDPDLVREDLDGTTETLLTNEDM